MRKFVVGQTNLLDNTLEMKAVSAVSEYQAIKVFMLSNASNSTVEKEERDWQKHPDYPKDKESLTESLFDADQIVEVIEI